jgi:hypothetical protein
MDGRSPLNPSNAPDLSARDGSSALQRAMRQPLMLGLFLPIQNGGWTPSDATSPSAWRSGWVRTGMAGAPVTAAIRSTRCWSLPASPR